MTQINQTPYDEKLKRLQRSKRLSLDSSRRSQLTNQIIELQIKQKAYKQQTSSDLLSLPTTKPTVLIILLVVIVIYLFVKK